MLESVKYHLHKLGEYNKTLVASVGGTLTVLSALLGLSGHLPEDVSAYLLSGSAALTAVSVWAVRNQDTIDKAGDDLADVLDKLGR